MLPFESGHRQETPFALVLELVPSWARQGQVVMVSLSAKSLLEVEFPLAPVLVSALAL